MDGGSGLFLRWTTSERQKPSATGEYSMRIRHALAGFAFAACLVSPTKLVASPKMDATLSQRHKRSEEHTSELQSLMRISYAVFCLKKNNEQYKDSQNKQ